MKQEDIRRMAHDIIDRCAVENDYIEYKKSVSFQDKILKTACAYANNYMNREIGLIFIGIEEVDDKESGEKAVPVRPISGIDDAQIESTENTLKSLMSHIHPKPDYKLIQDVIDDRTYIIVAIEPGKDGPYEISQKAEKGKKIRLKAGRYIRVRRDSRKLNKREEFELLKKFADYHFSSELNDTATLDDLNYEYMKEYLVRTQAAPDMRELSKLDMARSMGLIAESEYGGYRAKNFAVLMFADRPADYIPYAYVEIIREAIGTDKMESKIFDGPIWIQAQQVIRYFKNEIEASYNVRDSVTNETHVVYNWPEIMFSEIAINCILHKEYSRGNYVGIYWYRDHLTFINHNRPLPPVTIRDLNEKTEFADRQYLNKELKDMFFALNLIQSYGSGIRRAKRAMADNHSPELVFEPKDEDEKDYTQVTAYINEEFAGIRLEEKGSSEKDLEKTTLETTPETTPKSTREKIIAIIAETPDISRKEIAEAIGISVNGVKYHLKKLTDEGILQYVGNSRNGEWKLFLE